MPCVLSGGGHRQEGRARQREGREGILAQVFYCYKKAFRTVPG